MIKKVRLSAESAIDIYAKMPPSATTPITNPATVPETASRPPPEPEPFLLLVLVLPLLVLPLLVLPLLPLLLLLLLLELDVPWIPKAVLVGVCLVVMVVSAKGGGVNVLGGGGVNVLGEGDVNVLVEGGGTTPPFAH